jgi:hypothetical protein
MPFLSELWIDLCVKRMIICFFMKAIICFLISLTFWWTLNHISSDCEESNVYHLKRYPFHPGVVHRPCGSCCSYVFMYMFCKNIWWKFITLNFDMIICTNVVQSPPKCQWYKKTNNSFHKETYNHPFHAQINS